MRPIKRPLHCALVAASLVGSAVATALGHGIIPHDAPVDRLVTNLEKYTKEHPDDADGYYRLARVHTLALERKSHFVPVMGREEDLRPVEGSWADPDRAFNKPPADVKPDELKTHLSEAIKNLNKAIELRPTEARYHLTLACTLEAGESILDQVDLSVWPLAPVSSSLKPTEDYAKRVLDSYKDLAKSAEKTGDADKVNELLEGAKWWDTTGRDVVVTTAYQDRDDPKFQDTIKKIRAKDWHEQIESQYFVAMCLALPSDGRATEKPIWGGMKDWVSYEAGTDFIRVIEARKSRPTDSIRLKAAKATVKAFDELPQPNAITPIVLGLSDQPLSRVVSYTPSTFDLDGTTRPQHWQWLAPSTGILVWDPKHAGKITSGRQLFGSVSWWIFFNNGYEALDALDDNRDGDLSGPELDGLAVWFDRNSNGISDPGEVIPIDQLGIAAISCRATSLDGESPANLEGLRMTDGRVLPTYDWIAHPAQPNKQTPILPSIAALATLSTFGVITARRARRPRT